MDNKEMHKEEYLHLDLVNNCIEKKLSTLENDIKKYKNNISNGKENTSDVELISYEKTREKYNDINDAQNVPYFARMVLSLKERMSQKQYILEKLEWTLIMKKLI